MELGELLTLSDAVAALDALKTVSLFSSVTDIIIDVPFTLGPTLSSVS